MTTGHPFAHIATARTAAGLRVWARIFFLVVATIGCADDPVVPPTGSTIHGTVEDSNGQPAPGVVVIVGDRPAVTSGPDGSFEVDGVGSPYDVTVIQDTTIASVYMGLTRRDLRLRVPRGNMWSSATITGVVPPAAGARTKVFFAPSSNYPSATANPTTGSFGLTVDWLAPEPTLTGTLYVLRWTDGADGRPEQYNAFGSRDLLLTDQAGLINQDFTELDFTDPPEAEIRGSITIPTGHELGSVATFMRIGPGLMWLFTHSAFSAPFSTFQYVVPSVPGATFQLRGFSHLGGFGGSHVMLYRNGIVPPATDIVLDMPAAHEIIQPAHGAMDVDHSTLFQWTDAGRTGVYFLSVNMFRWQLSIWLSGTSARIPDLSAYGLGLPASAYGR